MAARRNNSLSLMQDVVKIAEEYGIVKERKCIDDKGWECGYVPPGSEKTHELFTFSDYAVTIQVTRHLEDEHSNRYYGFKVYEKKLFGLLNDECVFAGHYEQVMKGEWAGVYSVLINKHQAQKWHVSFSGGQFVDREWENHIAELLKKVKNCVQIAR